MNPPSRHASYRRDVCDRRLAALFCQAAAVTAAATHRPSADPTLAQRSAAATATAKAAAILLDGTAVLLGNGGSTAALVSGSVTSGSHCLPGAVVDELLGFEVGLSTYVVQKTAVLSATDIKFLPFSSGYTNLLTCPQDGTVRLRRSRTTACTPLPTTQVRVQRGHMQKHAALEGPALDNAALANEIQSRIGSDVVIQYGQPQLAGGITTNADNYARFLRILRGDLRMHDSLGTMRTPIPPLPDRVTRRVHPAKLAF
jgi:hypothetical protein